MTICNVNKLFVSCSQQLEIFFLPAVPTEHLDRKRQPQIPMTLHTVLLVKELQKILTIFNPMLNFLATLFTLLDDALKAFFSCDDGGCYFFCH